jgi:hypothetical protein
MLVKLRDVGENVDTSKRVYKAGARVFVFPWYSRKKKECHDLCVSSKKRLSVAGLPKRSTSYRTHVKTNAEF